MARVGVTRPQWVNTVSKYMACNFVATLISYYASSLASGDVGDDSVM